MDLYVAFMTQGMTNINKDIDKASDASKTSTSTPDNITFHATKQIFGFLHKVQSLGVELADDDIAKQQNNNTAAAAANGASSSEGSKHSGKKRQGIEEQAIAAAASSSSKQEYSNDISDQNHNDSTTKAAPAKPASGSSSSPYHKVLDKLKNPKSSDIVKVINNFIKEVRSIDRNENGDENGSGSENGLWDPDSIPGEDDKVAKFVRKFTDNLSMTLSRKNELFQTDNDIEWNNTLEGVEKYITSKLYGNNVAFAPTQRHRMMDERISNKIHKLSNFIQPKHLDIRDMPEDISEKHWEASASEIRKMNEFKSPRDKLVCILNCCRIVTF